MKTSWTLTIAAMLVLATASFSHAEEGKMEAVGGYTDEGYADKADAMMAEGTEMAENAVVEGTEAAVEMVGNEVVEGEAMVEDAGMMMEEKAGTMMEKEATK